MEIRCDAVLAFPRPLVWSTYRDRLVELVAYLPNIRGIEVLERHDTPDGVHFVNVWHGGGDIPAIARSFLSESMMSWTDLATWREADFETDWRMEPHTFRDAVQSSGTNRYVEVDGNKTRLEIRGELTVDASKVRGVPRLLAGKVSHAIEEFMVKAVSKNLLDVSRGVEKFLRERS